MQRKLVGYPHFVASGIPTVGDFMKFLLPNQYFPTVTRFHEKTLRYESLGGLLYDAVKYLSNYTGKW
jgi:hypothetical protein